jgi:hypothetical protein
MLDKDVFLNLERKLGPFIIDLFASHLNKQVDTFFSWLPDPLSKAVNAFSQVWPTSQAYAFPPFMLIAKLLERVLQEELSLVLIAPNWPQQSWFPRLLQLLYSHPIALPSDPKVLSHPRGHVHPLLRNNSLHLTAWPITGKRHTRILFQEQLPHLLQIPSDHPRDVPMNLAGIDGLCGVINNKLVRLIPL